MVEDANQPMGSGSVESEVPKEVGRAQTLPAGVAPASGADPAVHTATVPEATDAASHAVQQPPLGFGKGVNDYLNQYVVIADAKAAAVLAANLALGVALLDHKPVTGPMWVFAAAFAMLVLSSAICLFVVFPRLPAGGDGPIFWEDIRSRGSLAVYRSQLRSLDENDVERAYAAQNWYVSQLLHKKYRLAQWGIVTFALAVALCALWALGS